MHRPCTPLSALLTIVLGGAVALVGGPAAPAAAVLIDDFSTSQAVLSDPPGGASSVATGGADVLGQRRDLAVELIAGAGPVSADVSSGTLAVAIADTTPDSRGQAVVTWDGDADPDVLDATGLAPRDLTASGHSAFAITVASADAGSEVVVEVYTDAGNMSRAALRLPAVAAATVFHLSFAKDFVARLGTGADFADVGALVMTVRGTETGVMVDRVETVAPSLAVTKVDLTTSDVPIGSAQQPPGTRIKYRLTLTNTGGEALSVDLADVVDANTTLDAATVDATPIAVDDAYEALGHVQRMVAAAEGLLANDRDPDTVGAPPELVVTTVGAIATALGGSVLLAADGSFVYDPPAGVARAVDTFAYTVADNEGNSAAATAKVHLGRRVWFVDDDADVSAGVDGTGTLADPFDQLAPLSGAGGLGDVDEAGDLIFVRSGLYAGGIELEDGQELLGEGVALVVDGETVLAAGTAPTLTHAAGHAVVLAADNVLRGLVVGDTAGFGVSGNGFGTLSVADVAVGGLGGALSLSGGTLAATFTSIASTNAAGRGLELGAVAGSLTVTGGTTVTDSAQAGLRVADSSASCDFGATQLSSTGSGLELIDSPASTLTFASLAVTTDAGAGLLASNGGTLHVGGAGNTLVATGGAAVDVTATGFGSGVTFSTLSSSGSPGRGLHLDGVTGSFTATGGSISGAAGVAFDVNAGTGSISYGGSITNSANRSVEVTGRTASTVTVSGSINDTGTGIHVASNTGGTIVLSGASKVVNTGANPAVTLASNTGATIHFTGGGLDVDTTSGAGFTATGGAAAITVQGAGNTITTTTGTALNVANTPIGAANLNFQSISANGGANGIFLNNTCGGIACSAAGPAIGGLVVDGDGVNTSVGGNGSGGTIANTVGADGTTAGVGIYLDNTARVTLRRMTINGSHQNFGIRGFNVHGLNLEHSTVGGTSGTHATIASYGEGGVYFGSASGATGLTGSAAVTSCHLSGGRARNFSVVNTSGTLDRLTITGTTFGLTQAASDNDSLALEARNPGTVVNATVTGSTFTGAAGDLGDFTGQTGTTMDVVFQGNTCSNNHPNNVIGGGGMTFATQGAYTFTVSGNSFRGANGSAITLQKASAGTAMSGTLANNTIGVTGVAGSGSATGNGLFFSFAGGGTITLAITNNQIRRYSGNAGIFADNTGGNYDLNLTITGNLTAEPGAGAFAGLALAAGAPSSSDDVDVCAQIGGAGALRNDFSAGDPANANDVILGVSTGASSIRLPGYGGATLSDVQTFVFNNNNFSGTAVTAYVDPPATAASFTGGAACPLP